MKFAGLIPNNTSPTTFQAETVLTICEGQSAMALGAYPVLPCRQIAFKNLPKNSLNPRVALARPLYIYISVRLSEASC